MGTSAGGLIDLKGIGDKIKVVESSTMGTSYLGGTDSNNVAIGGLAAVAGGAIALDQVVRSQQKKQQEQQGNDPGLLARVQGTATQIEGAVNTASQLSNLAQGGIPGAGKIM